MRVLGGNMRTAGAAGLAVVVIGSAAGCVSVASTSPRAVTGSGELVAQSLELADFTRVDASQAFQVQVTVGQPFAVEVTTDDNLVDELRVRVSGDTLRIGLAEHVSVSDGTLQASIAMPGLTEVGASGASAVSVSGLAGGEPLEVRASGASIVTSSGVTIGGLRADLDGASRLELTGTGADADISAAGASTVLVDGLSLTDVAVELSGGSHASFDATGSITGRASGASVVTYLGSPTSVDVDTSGNSIVDSG